ncbi:hypothetical protein HWV62_11109 [Athelia sp. TMB]|nr:hypothetical protein HWV62_11109 [Athelia sp. TMB]
MTDYIRRLVSGNKARFKDGKLHLDLDLVYLTDQVIIMGYPASGIEGLYRNRREDAQKFLNHRHGKNFWVFNFCPVKENSYPASVFDGRIPLDSFVGISAPPLAILPLAAREMRAWLQGSPERVIVLHCKAGKGRSGTLACAYLLSLDDAPKPPSLERNYTAKEWTRIRADELMQAMPTDDATEDLSDKKLDGIPGALVTEGAPHSDHRSIVESPEAIFSPQPTRPISPPQRVSTPPPPTTSLSGPLKNVLDLHTSRRMKTPSSPSPKLKQGVSIPSQRRWLYYWSLLMAGQGPEDFWPPLSTYKADAPTPKVRITQIRIRMREIAGVKMGLARAANLVLERTGKAHSQADGQGHVWASIARYDDGLVETLEGWERQTRGEGGAMGRRKSGWEAREGGGSGELRGIFEGEKWDKGKMVRSFARMGTVSESAVHREHVEKDGKDEKITAYNLTALTDDKWSSIRGGIDTAKVDGVGHANGSVPSETNSIADATATQASSDNAEAGVLIDANREVRVKLYMGKVFMGWIWFIPTFHIPSTSTPDPTKILLTRKEIDFPLGIGASLVDVEISISPCSALEVEEGIIQPPARQTSEDSREGDGRSEPAGFTVTVQAVTAAAGLGEAVDAKQAAED